MRLLVISLLLLESHFLAQSQRSEFSHKIIFLIGNRKAEELDQFLQNSDFNKLTLEERADVIIAYSELYSWGKKGFEYSAKAYELAENSIKAYPNFWKFHYAIVVVLSHRVQKNNLLAITLIGKIDYHLSEALKYGIDHWEPHFLAGVRYLEVPLFPDLKKAEELLKRALELEPNHIFTYVVLGKLYEKKGDFCKALEIYNTALKLPIRPEWKIVDEDAKNEILKRIPEVSKKCIKR
uniref:Uncharacterized protein n=1 Tax=Fervidobacterium thailandense TaxID=1008305 RepID=A0A7C4GIN4_9BACT